MLLSRISMKMSLSQVRPIVSMSVCERVSKSLSISANLASRFSIDPVVMSSGGKMLGVGPAEWRAANILPIERCGLVLPKSLSSSLGRAL